MGIDRSAKQLRFARCSVPVALRAPAPGHARRYAARTPYGIRFAMPAAGKQCKVDYCAQELEKGDGNMRMKLCFTIVALVTAVHTAPVAWAEKAVSEKGRVVYHLVKTEVMQVGDVPGHILGIVDQRGLSFPDTGEVGTWSTKVIVDLTNGTGPHQSYTITTFEDRSTAMTVAKGTTTAQPDGTSTFEGTFVYIGGSGRFAGVKGEGSYRGKRMAPLTPGGTADAFMDYTATYVLPSQ
jgi:hypothetical protein